MARAVLEEETKQELLEELLHDVLESGKIWIIGWLKWTHISLIQLSFIPIVPLEISVWEGARHGEYGSFRFQMSHKKMPDGDYVPLHF